ncbi:MAG: hypothetical protein ACT4O2_13035 [Beijerinckiaceae bacterium]
MGRGVSRSLQRRMTLHVIRGIWMHKPDVISLQWLDEIVPAITGFFERNANSFINSLDIAALFDWITDNAVYIIGAILLALWLLGTFKK